MGRFGTYVPPMPGHAAIARTARRPPPQVWVGQLARLASGRRNRRARQSIRTRNLTAGMMAGTAALSDAQLTAEVAEHGD
jgi:hypothetical protein